MEATIAMRQSVVANLGGPGVPDVVVVEGRV